MDRGVSLRATSDLHRTDLDYLAVALRIYSPRNVTLLAIAVFWMLVKSFVEESFLRTDPQYAAYMTRVRVRWIPFVI
jgi:protein-S-isoprenylcysteine O-methyltransferase Ste14